MAADKMAAKFLLALTLLQGLFQLGLLQEEPPRKTLKFVKDLRNLTKEAGDFLRLRCEVIGDVPATKIVWTKNGAPLVEEKNRIKVKTKLKDDPQWSQLRFR